jgi:hypothetical protein
VNPPPRHFPSTFCSALPLSALLAACSPAGRPPAADLPAVVSADLDGAAAACTAASGKPLMTQATLRADLNADGREDYVVNVGGINCEGAPSVYGDREKEVSVFIGDGRGGATRVFADSTFGVTIEGTTTAAKLWLTFSGSNCGKPPASDFASETFCDRALDFPADAREPVLAPLETVRILR